MDDVSTKVLHTIRESQDWPIERWQRFTEIARMRNMTVDARLAECVLPVLHEQRWTDHEIQKIENIINEKQEPE